MLKCWRNCKLNAKVGVLPARQDARDMLTTCDEMISAVKMAQNYQSRTIQQGNIITYPDSNDGHKPSFDFKTSSSRCAARRHWRSTVYAAIIGCDDGGT